MVAFNKYVLKEGGDECKLGLAHQPFVMLKVLPTGSGNYTILFGKTCTVRLFDLNPHLALHGGNEPCLIAACIPSPHLSLSVQRSLIWIWMAASTDLTDSVSLNHFCTWLSEWYKMGTEICILLQSQPRRHKTSTSWSRGSRHHLGSPHSTSLPWWRWITLKLWLLIPMKQLICMRNNLPDKKNSSRLISDYENVCQDMIYVKTNKMSLLLYH